MISTLHILVASFKVELAQATERAAGHTEVGHAMA